MECARLHHEDGGNGLATPQHNLVWKKQRRLSLNSDAAQNAAIEVLEAARWHEVTSGKCERDRHARKEQTSQGQQ